MTGANPLDRSVVAGDAIAVARDLLGRCLVARVDGRSVAGRIVETEAYRADDPASHSHRGPTDRNRTMFGRPGGLYVYLSYGIHHCANVVTGTDGDGQAVLLRAVVPLADLDGIRRRRGSRVRDRDLANGPGKLCQALGIDRRHDGVDLCDPASPVRLVDDGWQPGPQVEVVVGPRIGITRGVDLPWRFRLCAPSGSS